MAKIPTASPAKARGLVISRIPAPAAKAAEARPCFPFKAESEMRSPILEAFIKSLTTRCPATLSPSPRTLAKAPFLFRFVIALLMGAPHAPEDITSGKIPCGKADSIIRPITMSFTPAGPSNFAPNSRTSLS